MPCFARLWESLEVPIGSPGDRIESLAYSRCTASPYMSHTDGAPGFSLNVLMQNPVLDCQHP